MPIDSLHITLFIHHIQMFGPRLRSHAVVRCSCPLDAAVTLLPSPHPGGVLGHSVHPGGSPDAPAAPGRGSGSLPPGARGELTPSTTRILVSIKWPETKRTLHRWEFENSRGRLSWHMSCRTS